MKNNELIVKANSLIEGFIEMSQNEYKLTLYLMSKINKEDNEFRKQRISVKEFSELLEVKQEWLYTYLKSFEDTLASRKIRIFSPNGDRLYIPWFGYVKYEEGEGIIEVAFNHDLSPFLLNIDIPYTKYFLENTKSLNSIYSMRIYELLKQYQALKSRKIEISELKLMLGILAEEYKNYADFKRRVILQAQKEINTKTDIYFEFEEIKESRRVVAIKFIISSNPNNNNGNNGSTRAPKKIDGPVDIEGINNMNEFIDNFKAKYKGTLEPRILQNMIKSHGMDHIQKCFDNFNQYISGSVAGIEGLFVRHIQGQLSKPTRYQKTPQHLDFAQTNYADEDFEKYYSNFKTKSPALGN